VLSLIADDIRFGFATATITVTIAASAASDADTMAPIATCDASIAAFLEHTANARCAAFAAAHATKHARFAAFFASLGGCARRNRIAALTLVAALMLRVTLRGELRGDSFGDFGATTTTE
jgi:hypothetical protein